jgi:histidinol-phosphate aminotransferase
MTGSLPFTRIIQGLPPTVPFVPPEALERRNARPLKVRVGANESAFGISPRAREAMCAAVNQIAWYNDPEGHDLRAALARAHGVTMDQLSIGSGIDDLLGLVVRLLIEPGDPVVSSLGGYPTFHYHADGFGGVLYRVPYRDDYEDLEALLAQAGKVEARLLYVANPDNPMGTWHPAPALRRLIEQLPDTCVLILDEAYVDFAPDEALLTLDPDELRVVRMRTFSKAHGMAGARVGYAIAHREMVAALDKVRNHFGVNRVAQAGALASLQDRAFIDSVVQAVAEGRREYEALGRELGLSTLPSGANFVAMDIGDGLRARALMGALLERDVFVRMPGVAPLDRCIRVTVGTPEEREAFAQVLRQVLPQIR